MDIESFVQSVVSLEDPPIPNTLPREDFSAWAKRLKIEADSHWHKNLEVSFACARKIIQIGEKSQDKSMIALGFMAHGDALKLRKPYAEAWKILNLAGEMFLSDGNEVGWARTRIGKLGVCVHLNQIPGTLKEADKAYEILTRNAVHDRRALLLMNIGVVHDLRGDYQLALSYYERALGIALELSDDGKSIRGMLHANMGFAEQGLGNLRTALEHFEQARALMVELDAPTGIAMADMNIADIARIQGQYRKALRLLKPAHELVIKELPSEATAAWRTMAECSLFLNRYPDVLKQAEQALQQYDGNALDYDLALIHLYVGTAQAEMGQLARASAALEQAKTILSQIEADTPGWLATIHWRCGQIAFHRGDLITAQTETEAGMAYFRETKQRVNCAYTELLLGQIAQAAGDSAAAFQAAQGALRVGRSSNESSLRYRAHLLLGQLVEGRGDEQRAMRHYQAAVAAINRVQRSLTLTLRPDFLEDKQEALHALIRLHFKRGEQAAAFEMLERTKSQVWLNYLTHRDHLRWMRDDPQTSGLINDLNRLRDEHHLFYRLSHDPLFSQKRALHLEPEQAAEEAAAREREMRAIAEQLYLHSAQNDLGQISVVPLRAIQDRLDDATVLIEFYHDSRNLWAFTIDRGSIEVHQLPLSVQEVDLLAKQLEANIDWALSVGAASIIAPTLTFYAQSYALELYNALIKPLLCWLRGRRRLVIVPYGRLHYFPFHLLFSGRKYLIERYEMLILPAASLITSESPQQPEGAHVIAHSWDGQLPYSLSEAKMVVDLLDGDLKCEEAATRALLLRPPQQVLHISAHGEHRADGPDFSYIQLADGPVYTDDLLQHDLSYELITLSACETGRTQVVAGDELIGLGRGFLYAGAGALVVSLWRVEDAITASLMEHFYHHLNDGASKAAAIRNAQRALLKEMPELHPAFWGAFELIGNADPLSKRTTSSDKEVSYVAVQ